MSGYEAMPHDTWPLIHEMTRRQYAGRPWPEELVVMHLRWLVGEHVLGRLRPEDWPTVRDLAAELGWKPARVARFLEDVDAWQDPARRIALVDLRGDRARGVNLVRDGGETAVRRQRDGGETSGTKQRRESEPQRDGGETAVRRQRDGGETSRATTPRASTLHPSPREGEGVAPATLPVESIEPPPPAPPDPPPPRPRALPADLTALGIGPDLGRRLVEAELGDVADLLQRTEEELRRVPGMGPDRARMVARRCERAGHPLGSVPRPTPPDPPRPLPSGPGPPRRPTQAERRSAGLRALDAALDALTPGERPCPP